MTLIIGCTRNLTLPGGEWSQWGPEAGHPSWPALPEGLLYELALRRWIDPPEGTFARLLLGSCHFDEVTVERQVVANGVLERRGKGKHRLRD